MTTRRLKALFIGILITGLAGCASIGPGSVTRDRFDYNASLGESWKRQILLNIVRMRYVEPVSFVDVGQIVAAYTLETGINLGGSATVSNFNTTAIDSSLQGKYTDRPTITYVPMAGSSFAGTLLTPFPPDRIMSTIQSGIPADMIFRMGVASINGLRNMSAPVSGFRPADEKFLRVVTILRGLQLSNAIRVKTTNDKDAKKKTTVSFWSKGAPPEISSQVRELCDLLGLDPSALQYTLVEGIEPDNSREIALQSFPLMHVLGFMAARVEIPEKDIKEGRAVPGVRDAMADTIEKGRFTVKCSDTKPQDAFVSVAYRGRWFWVDDRDIESKRVISFIMLVFTLTDTGKTEPLPTVTIPAQQ